MSYERLLHWMSELGQGGFEQFKASHAWATRDQSIWSAASALRELSALAHIEVDWRARRWGAVPPCITLLPDAAGHGLVVGARTARMTDALVDEVDAPDAVVLPVAQRDAPDAMYVAGGSETALAAVAEGLGLRYIHSVVEDLAAVLPGLDASIVGAATAPIVQHYGIERYDLDSRWLPADADEGPGLYRYERSGPRVIHFVSEERDRFAVTLAVGVWLEARRQHIDDWIWWRPEGANGTLDVPRNLPLPALHARAATLCTGLTPSLKEGGLRFPNVPRWLADVIATSLHQSLVIK